MGIYRLFFTWRFFMRFKLFKNSSNIIVAVDEVTACIFKRINNKTSF